MNARPRTLLAATLVLSALPAACAPDIMQDFTATYLINDPVDRFEIVVDRGTVQAAMNGRSVVQVKRHIFGLPTSIGTPDYSVEDGLVFFEAHCASRVDECTWDHMLDLTSGVSLDLEMTEANIDLGNLDADITAAYTVGEFHAWQLKSPHVDITAESSPVVLEFVAVPASVTVALQSGDVTITVPAGSYQCSFKSGDGKVDSSGISCDDAAAAVLDVQVGTGDITVTAAG